MGAALAQEPVCAGDLAPVPEAVSVAWVSPVRRRARGSSWLRVVRTTELQEALREETRPSVGRMLQLLGTRRKATDPRRRFKVTIFEARAADLCRPIEDAEELEPVAGLGACPPRLGRANRKQSGCGWTLDRADGSRGLDVYRIRWRDAAVRGFCVLPAERFVEER